MLFSQPDYAPDLEWMLQSGQVSQEMLLEALVQEFYVPIYRFVNAYLDNHKLAVKITDETFSNALSELHSYRPQDGVDIWLFRMVMLILRKWSNRIQTRRNLLAILPFWGRPEDLGDSTPENDCEAKVWLGIDRLDNGTRQIAILHYVLGWSDEQIAMLRNSSIESVSDALNKARDQGYQISSATTFLKNERRSDSAEAIDTFLSKSLQKRWPVPKTHQENIYRLINRINKHAGRISKRRQGLIYTMEIAVICLIILIGSSLAWETNRTGSAKLASTPSSLVITVIITEYVNVYITATPQPPIRNGKPTATPNLVQEDQYVTAQDNDTIESISEREGFSAQALQALNRVPDDKQLTAGDRLLRPDRWMSFLANTKRKLNLTEPATALEPPYLGEEILRRLAVQGSRYDTLWFDAQIIDYGPGSYIGPPRQLHAQTWLDGNQSLSLIGYSDQLPVEAMMHNSQGTFIVKPSTTRDWFAEWNKYDQDREKSLTIDELTKMSVALFDTRELERGSTFIAYGREMVAGIQALKFDVHNSDGKLTDRIWYDDTRGFILRRTQFLPGDPNTPLFDVQVDQVSYNTTLPGDFFNASIPWRGGYAQNASGTPANIKGNQVPNYTNRNRLPELALPINLDPAKSKLNFQYPATYPVDSPYSSVEVFSNHFLLGNTNLGNPWTMQCDRSIDGNWLAFDSHPLPPYTYTQYLNMVNLSNISAPAQHLEQSENVSVFSFSPDSKEIAFFTQSKAEEKGTLKVYSLVSSELKSLLSYFDVKSLVWSPDGTSLGMIARPEIGSYADYVVAYDIQQDKVTYSTPIDYESNAFQDWPMLKWGVEFPVEMGGMDSCASPPSG